MSFVIPLRFPEGRRLKEHLPRAAAAVLGLLIGAQALALWHEWPDRGVMRSTPAVPVGPSKTLRSGENLVASISGAALFGRAPPAQGSLDPASARNGHDGYSLKGIVALGGQDDGFAIIAGPDGRSRMLRKGDSLSGTLTVQAIAVDYVLLLDGDAAERLSLPHGTLAAGGTPRARRIVANLPTEPPKPERTINADTQSTLKLYGLSVIGDPRGEITGLSGRGSPGWSHSGLLPTDVIVAIDGKPVDEVLKTPGAIDQATIAAVTTLLVQRDGVEMEIDASPYDAPPPPSPALAALRRRRGG